MELIVISGVSGAGKSRAVAALEDMGFYCADNIPPGLIENFAAVLAKNPGNTARAAIVVDVRSREMFASLGDVLTELDEKEITYKILFLTADDRVLINRFNETRRSHPLASGGISLEQALKDERAMLEPVRMRADFSVDTTHLTNAQLKEQITGLFQKSMNEGLIVNCMSFGFKHGVPSDIDFVLDVRCLPNPFYIDELKHKTGLDNEVKEYVLSFGEAQGLIPKFIDLIDYLLPLYVREGRSRLVLGIGCTGGMHRSVVFAEILCSHIARAGYNAAVSHRDIEKNNKRTEGRA